MTRFPVLLVAALGMSLRIRCAFRHESCELALERLGYTSAPAFGDGHGRGVWKDLLFAFFHPVEDTLRRRLGRGLRDLKAAVHICVDSAHYGGMHPYALAGQERPQ